MSFPGGTSGPFARAVLWIGGVGMIVAGGWFAVDAERFIADAERAPGVVEDIVSKRTARGQKLYYPVVRYRTADGEPIVFTAKPGLWPSPFDIGDRVTVAYETSDPENARIVSFWMLWFLPATMALLGAGCLIAAWHTPNKTA